MKNLALLVRGAAFGYGPYAPVADGTPAGGPLRVAQVPRSEERRTCCRCGWSVRLPPKCGSMAHTCLSEHLRIWRRPYSLPELAICGSTVSKTPS
jgi:hypothetical protein